LLLLLSGVRLVTPDEAAGGGAQQAMVAGVMTGDAAHQRTLDAPFGLRHRRREEDYHCDSDCSAQVFHGNSVCLSENENTVVWFPMHGSQEATYFASSRLARRSTG
jgi:hypothetical protein